MNQVISIGKQDFSSLRENNCFYIDKSDLIREWWDSQDEITLITRPRRFGKTLNMSMLNYFFSNLYTDKKALFEDLSIWKEEKYRNLQGIYPVIFISFASVKGNTYQDTRDGVIMAINEAYSEHRYLLEWKGLQRGNENASKNWIIMQKIQESKNRWQMIRSAMRSKICPIACIVITKRKY